MSERLSVYFETPYNVVVRSEARPVTQPGQVSVKTLTSAISSGTEGLIYRGEFPLKMAVDENISALQTQFSYPLKYGYCLTGRVIECGPGTDPSWLGKLVFAFQPHTSHFCAYPNDILKVPDDVSPEAAVFLANMETAVNLVMDSRPMIGERVLISGQGVIGLLVTALLARFPLEKLITLDKYRLRREASLELGAHASLDPELPGDPEGLEEILPDSADLSFELSGAPEALNTLIAHSGFDSRIIVGSWYGKKRAALDLGGRFHRSRIRLISSQVSTISPNLSARWDKTRRFDFAWEMLRQVQPQHLITHRLPVARASDAYRMLDQQPEKMIQTILTYE